MNNLPQKTKEMERHRISPTNPVRRQLFAPEPDSNVDDQARIDNFSNLQQEITARDRFEKMQKWNFDFENEIPLSGVYEWFRCDGVNNWIGVKDTKIEDVETDNCLSMKVNNELTPKTENEEKVPLVRKRRNTDSDTKESGKGARRKISF